MSKAKEKIKRLLLCSSKEESQTTKIQRYNIMDYAIKLK